MYSKNNHVEGACLIMKTADGFIIKTSDLYPVSGDDPDDYNYPLMALISTPKQYTTTTSSQKTYDVVLDQ